MKIIQTGKEARASIKRGLDLVADCVKVTLGPAGRNAILGRKGTIPKITNDGVTIAKDIKSDDPIVQLGVDIAKEGSALTDMRVGDGTTTTAVLLQAICNNGFRKMDDRDSITESSVDAMQIKRDIDATCSIAREELKKLKRDMKAEELFDVAMVSVEDKETAQMLTDIFSKIGKDGFVSVETGTVSTTYEVMSGMEVKSGLLSEYFINSGNRFVQNNPVVAVTNINFETPAQVVPFATKLREQEVKLGTPLTMVLIGHAFTKEVIRALASNYMKENNPIRIVPLSIPYFDKNELHGDISSFTGATFIDGVNKKPDDFVFTDTGSCEKVVISDRAYFVGGKGNVNERVEYLRQKIAESSSEFDKDRMENRIGGMTSGSAIIKVGAYSEQEKEYRRLKIEDGVNAVRNALVGGIVPGGGLALKEVSGKIGTTILGDALEAPYKQIQKNAGGILEIKPNIHDAYLTIDAALANACSLAGILLTTEVAVADDDRDLDKKED